MDEKVRTRLNCMVETASTGSTKKPKFGAQDMKGHPDLFLLECNTYDDYLDAFCTRLDRNFLRNTRIARTLATLGHRSTAIYSPEEFKKRKAVLHELLFPIKKTAILFSAGLSFNDRVLKELADRELVNKQKAISTIIFLKHRLKSGFEISGYVDFEESLRHANLRVEKCNDWAGIFRGSVKLRPKPHDLSYYDWHKNIVHHNNSDNYIIVHDVKRGLTFMHRGDHKKFCVNRSVKEFQSNVLRSMFYSEKYGHVVFYDHVVRKKI